MTSSIEDLMHVYFYVNHNLQRMIGEDWNMPEHRYAANQDKFSPDAVVPVSIGTEACALDRGYQIYKQAIELGFDTDKFHMRAEAKTQSSVDPNDFRGDTILWELRDALNFNLQNRRLTVEQSRFAHVSPMHLDSLVSDLDYCHPAHWDRASKQRLAIRMTNRLREHNL